MDYVESLFTFDLETFKLRVKDSVEFQKITSFLDSVSSADEQSYDQSLSIYDEIFTPQ